MRTLCSASKEERHASGSVSSFFLAALRAPLKKLLRKRVRRRLKVL